MESKDPFDLDATLAMARRSLYTLGENSS